MYHKRGKNCSSAEIADMINEHKSNGVPGNVPGAYGQVVRKLVEKKSDAGKRGPSTITRHL